MSIFVRSIAVLVLVAGLTFVVGCTPTNSGNRPTNIFSFPRAEQVPEGATRTTMNEVLGRDRVSMP